MLARSHNDTLDNSLLLAREYQKLSRNEMAIDILLSGIDSSDDGYYLNQKGKLLLELGVPEAALKAFDLAKKDSSAWQDAGALAQAMIENGFWIEAREYLVKNVEKSWDKSSALRKLYNYDLDYGKPDSALVTYRKFTEENFWNDPVGIYRTKMMFVSPVQHYSFDDVLRFSLLLLLIIAVVLIPYLWVLPIHYTGLFIKKRGMILPESEFRWNLRHFWILCSLMIFVDVAGILILHSHSILPE